jgi:hypothetical protein
MGLRALILRRDPVCVECHRAPSAVADHIADHEGNLELFFDEKNVRGICKACHDRKTGMEHGFHRKPRQTYLSSDRVFDPLPEDTVKPISERVGADGGIVTEHADKRTGTQKWLDELGEKYAREDAAKKR